MRLVQFVKWWWGYCNDAPTRSVVGFLVFWALPCAIASIWIGNVTIALIALGVIAILGGWVLYGLFCFFRTIWVKFNDECPTEEVAIMRKLKGIPTPSRKEVYPETEHF